MSNTPDTYDWPTIKNMADRDLSAFKTGKPMLGSALRGKNFMTDERLGIVRINDETIEISTGWSMDHRIYGVTFDRVVSSTPDDRDTSTYNWTDVMILLNELATASN